MHNHDKVMKTFLETRTDGFDLNAKSNNDRTPLHLSAIHNAFRAAGLLVDAGADVNARDEAGKTPLMLCTSDKVARLLLTCDINATDNNSWTPLHHACQNGRAEVAALL